MTGAWELGLMVFVAGTAGAGVVVTRLENSGRGRLIPLLLVPCGAAIGSGAALVRGWDVLGSGVAGAALLPLFAIVSRLVEVRRRARRDEHLTR